MAGPGDKGTEGKAIKPEGEAREKAEKQYQFHTQMLISYQTR
jgi:hypothetical protein